MKEKKHVRKYTPDGEWKSYRTPGYYEVLLSTAWSWITAIDARVNRPPDITEDAALQSYNRTIITLPQLPLENGGSGIEKRFDRSRWRDASVSVAPGTKLHSEHPWSKHVTKRMLWEAGSAALLRGARREDLVHPFTEIIDARQDAVLLPHERVSLFGIVSELRADGLLGRYSSPIREGRLTLLDRATGSVVTLEEIEAIEAEIARRTTTALRTMEGLQKVNDPV